MSGIHQRIYEFYNIREGNGTKKQPKTEVKEYSDNLYHTNSTIQYSIKFSCTLTLAVLEHFCT